MIAGKVAVCPVGHVGSVQRKLEWERTGRPQERPVSDAAFAGARAFLRQVTRAPCPPPPTAVRVTANPTSALELKKDAPWCGRGRL